MLTHTDLGKVQLGPSDDHSAFSPLFRCSWRKETAPAVMDGLSTDAAMAGPRVVFTICESIAAVGVTENGEKEWETPSGLVHKTNLPGQGAQRRDAPSQVHPAA